MRAEFRVIAVFLLIAARAAFGGDFEEANQLFDEGKFSEARQRYERLVERGEWNANLFYNLGNANHRLGAPGLAILNYERALALEPSHPEATANLKLLRDQTNARLPEPSRLDRIFPRVSTDFFVITAAIAGWLAILCTCALIARRSPAFTALAVLALLIAAFSTAAVWHAERDASLAIIVAKDVQARLAPADRAGLAEALPAGSRVRVLSERGEWIYCALPGGGLGWLPATSLEKVRLPRA